jgi:hypothetical protein
VLPVRMNPDLAMGDEMLNVYPVPAAAKVGQNVKSQGAGTAMRNGFFLAPPEQVLNG